MSIRPLSIARLDRGCLAAVLLLLLAGCSTQSYFVDGALKDASVSQIDRLDRPRPVQLLFAYKTRNLTDPIISDLLEQDIAGVVSTSGLFAAVNGSPVPGGAIVSVTIERFPDVDAEFSRGLATGLTFGIAGSTRTDPFVCTVDYVAAPGAEKLTTTAGHAIHIPLGLISSRPKDMVIAKSWRDALRTVARQSVAASLQQLSQSPDFRKEAQTP